MTKRGTPATEAKGGIDARRFEETIRRMLKTPPTPHKQSETTGKAAAQAAKKPRRPIR